MDTNLKTEPERDPDAAKVGDMTAGMGEDITLRIRAEVDGEEVLNREGDSLTWGFVQFLHRQMRGFGAKAPRVWQTSDNKENVFITGTDDSNTNFRFEWKVQDRIENNSYDEWGDGNTSQDFIYLTGHPEIENRPFFIADHSSFSSDTGWIELNEAEFDPATMSWVDTGNPFAPSDPSTFSLRGGEKTNRVWSTAITTRSSYYDALENTRLYLGAGTQPMSLSNVGAANYNHPNFSYDSQGRPAPVINTNDANLKWSRTVTNNQASNVDITELLLRKPRKELVAKDIFAAVTIPSGSSATFYYQIEVNNSSGGGVMAQFLELLYRHTDSTSRECPDIFNNNRTEGRSYWTFRLAMGTPGQSVAPGGGSRDRPRNIGLMVGTGTDTVANTDFALANRIVHGDAAGELHHYGMFITDYTIDEANGRLFFEVERVFENRTGSSITINEVGLYAGAAEYANRERYAGISGYYKSRSLRDQHLITRNVLETSITIGAGKLKKLYYEVGIKI
jgi:hypothetical protein